MEKVVKKKTIKRKKNTQGAKANYSGQRFEDKCEELFKRENFIIMSYQKYVSLHDKPKRALVKNCPYKNGKGGVGKTRLADELYYKKRKRMLHLLWRSQKVRDEFCPLINQA